ncbi:trypsin-like peptidase domain-containing protein [Sorangium sp. So ce1128]
MIGRQQKAAWDGPSLVNLGDVLADLYPTREDSYRVVGGAGLNRGRIRFSDAAVVNWFNILDYAKNQDQVPDIVDFALREHPRHELLRLARERGSIPAVRGVDIRSDVHWRGPETPGLLEQLMGSESTLVDVSFLEIGAQQARAVARVVLPTGGTGSGFLIKGGLFITNHHVLHDASEAKLAALEFNFQKTTAGLDASVDRYRFAPDTFFRTSEEDDWTAVAVAGNPEERWGCVELAEIEIDAGHRVNIIQHPGGGPKQVSFYHNAVVFVGNDRVQYLTDTLPGSSGSPVFDKQWRVVAVHHSGGWMSEPGAETRQIYYRNEGIHINTVIRGLRADGVAVA